MKLALISLSLLLVGCTPQRPDAGPLDVRSETLSIPPHQLLDQVARAVSAPPIGLPVQSEGEGGLITGWQPFRGELHVVRYWYERTRYHIRVIPDWTDPTHRSRIEVTDETQQRPADSGPNQEAQVWSDAPQLRRPERAQALLRQIETELQRRATASQ